MSGAVFLSYASQDAEAAKRVSEALRAAGIEVWLDQSELVGGDAWDQSIRRQIKECALFIPILSETTQSRREAYFRLEWKLADERTHLMAKGTPFLLPVTIDGTSDHGALVPESFLTVQWTRLPTGEAPPAFVERVKTLLGGGSTINVALPSQDRRGGSGYIPAKQKPAISTWIWALLAVVLIGSTVTIVSLRTNKSPDSVPATATETAPAATAPKIDAKSVAVLPFADLSEGHNSEYFSDGISEELLNVLAKVPGLKVTARTSSFFFRGKNVPVQEIAAKLNVAYVIEGTVQRSGESVRITAQLVKAADGFEVWSEQFDRELKNVFALQDEIAGLIVKNLSLKLGASSTASTATVNPQAFELYVQGRQAWNLRTHEGFARAELLLNRAIELSPDFAQAHAALADVALLRAVYGYKIGAFGQRNSPERTSLVAQIDQVLVLDPESAEAHASLGNALMQGWDLDGAERELRRAIALNPNYATAHHWLGIVLFAVGRMDDALAETKLSTELDPLSPAILGNYSWALHGVGWNREALKVADHALALQPDSQTALGEKARILAALGRLAEAAALARQLPADQTDTKILALGQSGFRAEADALLAGLDSRTYWPRSYLLLSVGHREEALEALDDPSPIKAEDCLPIYCDPLYDEIRDSPRFGKFLETLSLTAAHARAQAWRKARPTETSE
jgi:TolB-like protein